ncbi:hypothetical protein KFL_015450020, partial [Klebsormidium nitens]
QHRDQRRYDHVRKTGYRPKERKFEVGDLAYLRRQPADKTDVSVTRGAYRVHQVGSNGRMVLQGADGTLFKEHIENCAPCHNPNIDITIDPTLTTVTAGHACQICKSPGRQATMLLCDYCLEGYHMSCLEPAVKEVPKGSNGLTERLVRTIKDGVTRYGTEADRRTWDEWLPYLAMGYRMSPQAALGGYSPYFLLHGRHPMLTGEAVKWQLVGTPIDFDTPEQCVEACQQRAVVLQREMPLALGNLLVAQHRDQRRYDHVRKTGYRPKERKFEVGDLAYLRRQPADKTDVSVTRGAYRVHQVGSNGRMVLQGADGTLFKEHIENCAPCHNPNIDITIDPTLTTVTAGHACQICKSPGRQATMLLCDYCLEGYHMSCLEPAVKEVPKGVWLCPSCT